METFLTNKLNGKKKDAFEDIFIFIKNILI